MFFLNGRRHVARIVPILVAGVALSYPLAAPANNSGGAFSEYQVKAAFLYNFAKFVEWPEEAFSSPDAPLVIAVLGEDPFGTLLDETVRGEAVGGHKLEVRRIDRLEAAKGCHTLFISASEKSELPEILAAVKDSGALTVSDVEGFARRGGIISFRTVDGKVQFEINLETAKRERLKVSSRLLKLADVVGE
jgi:hypothetical protein